MGAEASPKKKIPPMLAFLKVNQVVWKKEGGEKRETEERIVLFKVAATFLRSPKMTTERMSWDCHRRNVVAKTELNCLKLLFFSIFCHMLHKQKRKIIGLGTNESSHTHKIVNFFTTLRYYCSPFFSEKKRGAVLLLHPPALLQPGKVGFRR